MISLLDQIALSVWRASWQATVLAVIVAATLFVLRDRLTAKLTAFRAAYPRIRTA